MKELYTFSFQKEHRELGCEDAPPVAERTHLIVCDGLGGSGKDPIPCVENGEAKIRTSAYIGSRILSDYTDRWIKANYSRIADGPAAESEPKTDDFRDYVFEWFEGLDDAYAEKRKELGLAEPQVGQKMLFPSTLACTLLFPHEDKLRLLMMWAGDSRIYSLSSKNGLEQLSMDDSEFPFDSIHSTSHMRNCLAHQRGRVHHINYAYTEIEEDAIVFCCSDGVTDYLPSPMTLECVMYVLSRSQYESSEPDFVSAFAEKISRIFFRTIYDDTTMAGAFWGFNDRQGFESAYMDRIVEMMPVFEKTDDIIHREDEKPSRILGLFKRKPQEAVDSPRFQEIWKAYEKGYQRFRRIEIKRIYEDEL